MNGLLKKFFSTTKIEAVWRFVARATSPLGAICFRKSAIILMLHRVSSLESHRLFPNENMKISSLYLENLIQDFIKQGFSFISLGEMHQRLSNQEDLSQKIVMTLDDGFEDNYTNAWPIFRKYNIPFTIYVCSLYIDEQSDPWWNQLECLLLQNKQIFWNGKIWFVPLNREKSDLFLRIRETLLSLPRERFEQEFRKLLEQNSFDFSQKDKFWLSWQQIRELAQDPLCTIGNHTHSHTHLTVLSSKEQQQEFLKCQQRIEAETGIAPEHLCYPYGDVDRKLLKSIQSLRFKTATTTTSGVVNASIKSEQHQLPRFFVTEGLFVSDILGDLALQTGLGLKKGIL